MVDRHIIQRAFILSLLPFLCIDPTPEPKHIWLSDTTSQQREILTSKHRLHIRHMIFSKMGIEVLLHFRRDIGIVEQQREFVQFLEFSRFRAAAGIALSVDDTLEAVEQDFAPFLGDGTNVDLEGGDVGYDVDCVAGFEAADCDDGGFVGRYFARDECLEAHDDVACYDDGVDAVVGHAAVTAAAVDRDAVAVGGGHGGAGSGVDCTRAEGEDVLA